MRDYRRLIDAPDEATCPMIVTTLTNANGGIERVVDTRRELERVYPWIHAETWGMTGLIQP